MTSTNPTEAARKLVTITPEARALCEAFIGGALAQAGAPHSEYCTGCKGVQAALDAAANKAREAERSRIVSDLLYGGLVTTEQADSILAGEV